MNKKRIREIMNGSNVEYGEEPEADKIFKLYKVICDKCKKPFRPLKGQHSDNCKKCRGV